MIDIVDLALKGKVMSDDNIIELIKLVFPTLRYFNTQTSMLFKLLIYYERIKLFEACLKLYIVHTKGAKIKTDQNSDLTYQERIQRMGLQSRPLRKLRPNQKGYIDSQAQAERLEEYEFDEILSDAFSYSIEIDKIHLSFYFYRLYKEDVFVVKEDSINSIIKTLQS